MSGEMDCGFERLPCLPYVCGLDPAQTLRRKGRQWSASGLGHGVAFADVLSPETLRRRGRVLEGLTPDKPFYRLSFALRLADGSFAACEDYGEALFEDGLRACVGFLLLVGQWEDAAARRQECDVCGSGEGRLFRLGEIIGKSPAIQKLYGQILQAAKSGAHVLVSGESGTGKALVARQIHELSPYREGAFVSVNCASIPEERAEELFFGRPDNGADALLARADGGTLFLDEVSELSGTMQARLLRVLDGPGALVPGTASPGFSRFRIVAGTRRSLDELVSRGQIREDFYYRINVLSVSIPPLRERREDIPLLMDAFLERMQAGFHTANMPQDTLKSFLDYEWPGNVRELMNALQRFLVTGSSGIASETKARQYQTGILFADEVRQFESRLIREALLFCEGHTGKTAQALGLNVRTLQRKIRDLRIR